MKILVLDNLFTQRDNFHSNHLYKWFNKIRQVDLTNIIKELFEKYGRKIEIILYSDIIKQIDQENIRIKNFSDFRLKIDRERFLEIQKEILSNIRNIFLNLNKKLRKTKSFHLEGIFLVPLLEYNLAEYLKKTFEVLEVAKSIINSQKYEKIVFTNYNGDMIELLDYFKAQRTKMEYHIDKTSRFFKIIKAWPFFKYIIGLINFSFKKLKFDPNLLKSRIVEKNQVLFISNTRNQFLSIKSVFDRLQEKRGTNVILYQNNYSLSIKDLAKLLIFIFRIKKTWKSKKNKAFDELSYKNVQLRLFFRYYYDRYLFFSSVRFFNIQNNFKNKLMNASPKIVVLPDELRAEARLYSNFCRKLNIPTLYIPHAGVPIYKDLIYLNDFYLSAVPGKEEKKYLIKKGVPEQKIIVSGKPKHDFLLEEKIKEIEEVKDIFSEKKYRFKEKNFTILYATSRVDTESSMAYDREVLLALKELNLLGNLIIKIHPSEYGHRHKWVLDELNITEPIIVKDYDIIALAKASDLFVSRSSYTILEAMMVGTPVIVLDLVNVEVIYSGYYNFIYEKDVLLARNKNELVEGIEKLKEDINFFNTYSIKLKDISKKYTYISKKKCATEKIVDIMDTIGKDQGEN